MYPSDDNDKRCATCRHYVDFTGVCVSADSPRYADYTGENYICKAYEPRKGASDDE